MSHASAVSHGDFGRAAFYQLDRPITTHAHREGHLVFYVSGATGRVRVGCSSIACDQNSAISISPWEPHSFDVRGSVPCLCLVMYIKPMWFLEHCGFAEFALSFGRRSLPMTPDIAAMVRRLAGMMYEDSGDPGVEPLLLELSLRYYEASWAGLDRHAMSGQPHRLSDFRVRRSQRLMRENLREHGGLDTLACQVGLSRPHFFKLFKLHTGVTPNVYFNTLRSEAAIEELIGTPKSVTEISEGLGFATQASFTRFFSMNVGISPSEYRRATMTA